MSCNLRCRVVRHCKLYQYSYLREQNLPSIRFFFSLEVILSVKIFLSFMYSWMAEFWKPQILAQDFFFVMFVKNVCFVKLHVIMWLTMCNMLWALFCIYRAAKQLNEFEFQVNLWQHSIWLVCNHQCVGGVPEKMWVMAK